MVDYECKYLLRKAQIEKLGGAETLRKNPHLEDLVIYSGGFGEFFYLYHSGNTESNDQRYNEWRKFWKPVFRRSNYVGDALCYHHSATAETTKQTFERLRKESGRLTYATLNPKLPKNLIHHLVILDPEQTLTNTRIRVFSVFKLREPEKNRLERYIRAWQNNCSAKPTIFRMSVSRPYCFEIEVDMSIEAQEAIHLLTLEMEDYSSLVCPLEFVVIGGSWEPRSHDLFERGDFRGMPRTWWPRLRRDYVKRQNE